MELDVGRLKDLVRDVPEFPQPGVTFKDITPLLADPVAFRMTVDAMADHFAGRGIARVVGIEARGFILAAPVAYRLGASFVPVRKRGKLPWQVARQEYLLEYGSDELEVHRDGIGGGERVLIVDDVLATGGTSAATVELVRHLGGTPVGLAFLIELDFLRGRDRLEGLEVLSLLGYE
jgi:adenine phosphoribosyltransferase